MGIDRLYVIEFPWWFAPLVTVTVWVELARIQRGALGWWRTRRGSGS